MMCAGGGTLEAPFSSGSCWFCMGFKTPYDDDAVYKEQLWSCSAGGRLPQGEFFLAFSFPLYGNTLEPSIMNQ